MTSSSWLYLYLKSRNFNKIIYLKEIFHKWLLSWSFSPFSIFKLHIQNTSILKNPFSLFLLCAYWHFLWHVLLQFYLHNRVSVHVLWLHAILFDILNLKEFSMWHLLNQISPFGGMIYAWAAFKIVACYLFDISTLKEFSIYVAFVKLNISIRRPVWYAWAAFKIVAARLEDRSYIDI